MNILHLSRTTSLCAFLLGLASSPAGAQVTSPEKEATDIVGATLALNDSAPVETRFLQLRNVKPSLLAYWLDHAHNEAPPEVRRSQSIGSPINDLARLPRLPGNGNGPLGLKLPEGVQSVFAIDPQNRLGVRGTKEGIDALSALLPTIDVLLIQYEIEARFIQTDRSTLAKAGLKFPKVAGNFQDVSGSVISLPATSSLWTPSSNPRDGKIKVLTSPRVLVIDGTQASVQQTTFTPLIVDDELLRQQPSVPSLKTASLEELASTPSATKPGVAMVSSEIGIRTAVLRRPNNLTTLGITPTFGGRTVTVETTIREDQGIAIQMSQPQDKQQLVVLVKVTRVRRVGE